MDDSLSQRGPRPPLTSHDYVLLSDVHLGSDIVPHLRPGAVLSWFTREAEVDERLVAMLEHHRRTRREGRPLCVVIAGDLLELVGVSLTPTAMTSPPTREERLYGLGSAPDHVAAKVRAIAARHPRVFRALMELVSEDNRLVVVRGNHDVELHWHAAQQAFVAAILAHAPAERHAELRARIAIEPWFFHVPGLLYVEHGHQFDPMCCYGDPLLPTCPRDTRRIRRVPFSVMVRNVARPTRGLSTARYEHVSFAAYLGLLATLGVVGSVRIAVRFARASLFLLLAWLAHVRGERDRGRHRARVLRERFAGRSGVTIDQLAQLAALHVRPAAASLGFVLKSLYLDRVLAIGLACASVVLGALLTRYGDAFTGISCAMPAGLLGAYACVGSARDIVPTERMRTSARVLARQLNVRWVVMGHTHAPGVHALEAGSQYVNLGNWGEDDLPDERRADAQTPCTYLHLRQEQGAYRATLMRWDAREGALPAALDSEAEPLSAPKSNPSEACAFRNPVCFEKG